jgi:hypothetical protein
MAIPTSEQRQLRLAMLGYNMAMHKGDLLPKRDTSMDAPPPLPMRRRKPIVTPSAQAMQHKAIVAAALAVATGAQYNPFGNVGIDPLNPNA